MEVGPVPYWEQGQLGCVDSGPDTSAPQSPVCCESTCLRHPPVQRLQGAKEQHSEMNISAQASVQAINYLSVRGNIVQVKDNEKKILE